MPPPLNITGPCEVCDQPAHGKHFGVISCRACAAFFRRAARINSKSQDIICERGNCKVSDSGIFFCKACRLKKCIDVGMDSSKFQSNRDPISSSQQICSRQVRVSSPQSLANFLGRPELILLCEPDRASTSKFVIDVSFLIDKAFKAFQEPVFLPSPLRFENSLERLANVLENIQVVDSEVILQTKVGQNEILSFWEQSFIKTVKWFSQFPEFTELPMNIKLDILKSSWLLWIRLERQAETANLRRRKLLADNEFMAGEGRCMDMKNYDSDLAFCTNYTMDQLRQFLEPDCAGKWKLSVDVLIQLEPTNIELNFMLIQLCLNYAQKRFPSETREVIDKLLATQADNLHDYYTRKMKTPNYSGRITRMMKVIQYIEADVRDQREKMHLANVFDIFNLDFTHPEMFEFF
uniref:Nuclear Hormone Receptor family n=1 Tax=Caenorhabditis tropicalis TaxID=1561998 RepID=A0A1I7TAT1_9PELO